MTVVLVVAGSILTNISIGHTGVYRGLCVFPDPTQFFLQRTRLWFFNRQHKTDSLIRRYINIELYMLRCIYIKTVLSYNMTLTWHFQPIFVANRNHCFYTFCFTLCLINIILYSNIFPLLYFYYHQIYSFQNLSSKSGSDWKTAP